MEMGNTNHKMFRAAMMSSLLLILTLQTAGQTPESPNIVSGPKVIPAMLRQPMAWVGPDTSSPPLTQYKTFYSKTIKGQVGYLIYLPPDYDQQTTTRYPALYYLHGSGNSPQGHAILAKLLDEAIRAHRVGPMIMVFVNGLRGNTMYCDSRDGKWPLETVIIKDLIPYIDATYRTIASREGRAIEGFSAGGFGAAHLGLKYPEVFGVVSIKAPALLDPSWGVPWQVLFQSPTAWGGDMAYEKANDPFTLVQKNADALRDRTLIRIVTHSFGPWQPNKVNRQAERVEQLHQLMVKLGISHEYYYLMNVRKHDFQWVAKTMGDANFSFFSALPNWKALPSATDGKTASPR
jgi:enterochelin esterase-like enzyme